MNREQWAGQFGNEYVDRNPLTADFLGRTMKLWRDILAKMQPPPATILEVGANVGVNLWALKLLTNAMLEAIEPNEYAREKLIAGVNPHAVAEGYADEIPAPDACADLVFTSGVLIHVDPDDIEKAMQEVVRVSKRYILAIEYFAHKEEEVIYRGNRGMLWRRDYGSMYLDLHPELKVLGYGFAWRRMGYADNLNWWLFEKPQPAAPAPNYLDVIKNFQP